MSENTRIILCCSSPCSPPGAHS